MQPTTLVDWSAIDTVLLDMDGTLLDLGFDNWFWQEHLPREFAAARGLGLAAARAELEPRFRALAGTMEWYCIDHWSRELCLDIAALKRAAEPNSVRHRSRWALLFALAGYTAPAVSIATANC